MVDEEFGLERLLKPQQQRIVHGSTGKAELAHRVGVSSLELWVRKEVVVQRGHEVQMTHPLRFDGSQCRGGIKSGHADKAPIDKGHCQQRTHTHGVVQRHHAKGAFPVRIAVLSHVGECRHPLRTLAPWDAFGRARCARRVEHQGQVFGAGQRCWVSAFFEQVIKAVRLTTNRANGHARDGLTQNGALQRLFRRSLEHQKTCLGVTQHVVNLLGLGAPVQWRHH